MSKLKLTKGELKSQREALGQFQRYLPTLQLKKQQLQMEILHQLAVLEKVKHAEAAKTNSTGAWSELLAEPNVDIRQWLIPKESITTIKKIAGVSLPVFEGVDFIPAEYDLFIYPLWVDAALEALKELVCLRQEAKVIEQGMQILRHELRITTQRVNLFEKIKIPEASEAIRLIKIYLGDQMTNAFGRSKIAKRKIETAILEEVPA